MYEHCEVVKFAHGSKSYWAVQFVFKVWSKYQCWFWERTTRYLFHTIIILKYH